MVELTLGETAARIGSALVLGALVGLERERKQRPAGFRTMILVSLGSAAFMVTAMELISTTAKSSDGQAEMSRVLQGLIGGVGFLGAGAVIQSKKAVRGMTTAAAVWVTAAIGAACGLGQYMVATVVAVATLFTLIVLEIVEDRYFPDMEDGNGNGGKPPAAGAVGGAAGGNGPSPQNGA
ncbi:MAG: MgtC/SapB family protein [Phycisphaerales bacterium]